MDLEALRNGNFAMLGTAVDDWSSVVTRLETMETYARDDLKAKADKANWAGVNATLTREFITKTAGEFTDALTQATSIRNILRDTRNELVKYRGELQKAIDEAWDDHLTVLGTKGGGFTIYVNVHPEPADSKEAMEGFRAKIEGILEKATTSDSTASRVLRAIAEQADYGFSGAEYKDRDSAAEALERADAMAKLAKNAEDMSASELDEFNSTLAKYKDDELFAAQFATKLGAKETLQFWTDMSEVHAGASGTELKELQEFQKNLSVTLATATVSDADGMQAWKKNILDEANTSFRANPMDSARNPTGALGIQVMSSLMGHGKYDSEFLDAYGKKLLKADMAPAGSPGMGTKDVWEAANSSVDLVFGKGNGQDPVNGFMKALSHNPEAATDAFDNKSVLEHVLESTKYTDRGASVGVALEAAVTGVADEEMPTDPRPHNKIQIEIMNNVMHAVAQPDGGAKLVNKAMGESFGDMAAAYMPEISRSLNGRGADSVFLMSGEYANEFDPTDVTRFLYEVARDEKGEASIILGESVYTASVLEAHISDPSLFNGESEQAISAAAQNAGLIEGIVGRSKADEGIASGVEAEKTENEALKNKGDFVKSILAAGVGVGTVALVPAGPGGAMVGGAASGFFGGVAGMAVDRLVGAQEVDGALDTSLYETGRSLNESQQSASVQAQEAAVNSIEMHDSNLSTDSIKLLIERSLNDGWVDSDTKLEDVRARPSA